MSKTSISQLHDLIKSKEFADYGFAHLDSPISMEVYELWIAEKKHGEMKYLQDHAPLKRDPKTLFPLAQSAIVITKNYLPHPYPVSDPLVKKANIAQYARGEDYHIHFQSELDSLVKEIRQMFPHDYFTGFSDSHPILERDLAYRAGLGWFGKNSMLINKIKGSFFYIGEIVSSLALQPFQTPSPDHCGTCTRCVEACPTSAILPDTRTLQADRCISYLTIEKKGVADVSLRDSIGDWFFGCDICQTVCPWNEKVFRSQEISSPKYNDRVELAKMLSEILSSSNKQLQRRFQHSPLSRARGNGLKRNALIVIANLNLKEALPALIDFNSANVELMELQNWALQKLGPTDNLSV